MSRIEIRYNNFIVNLEALDTVIVNHPLYLLFLTKCLTEIGDCEFIDCANCSMFPIHQK